MYLNISKMATKIFKMAAKLSLSKRYLKKKALLYMYQRTKVE